MARASRSKTSSQTTGTGLPWHVVETAINREVEWLREAIPGKIGADVPGCDNCLYTLRKIALLIVTGTVEAKEFAAREGHDLWDDLTVTRVTKQFVRHGGEWHRQMMAVLSTYFEKQGFEVVSEPYLPKGRADLGVYKDGYRDLFVEVGTTAAYKLWWNLEMLSDCVILLVPEESHAVEFICKGHNRYPTLLGTRTFD